MNLKYRWLMGFSKSILTLCFVLSIFGSYTVQGQIASDLLVIANEIGSTNLTKKQVIAYAKGEKNFWPNSKKVVIVLPSAKSEIAEAVALTVYKTNSGGMQKYWLSLIFQGRADPPVFLGNDEETIRFIEKNKGAIGFISAKNKSKANDYLIEVKTD